MFSLKSSPKKLFQQQWKKQLSEYITALSWSKDGDLAASSAAGEVMLWQSQIATLILTPAEAEEKPIDCLEFSSDGQFLASGGQDGKIRIWQIKPQVNLIHSIETGEKWIEHLSWHPQNQELAFSLGRYVQILDAVSAQIIVTLPFLSSSVLDLAWHPLGDKLAIAGNGGVKIWEATDRDNDPLFLEMPAACTHITWSSDGKYLAASCMDLTVWVWSEGSVEPWRMTGFSGKIRNLTWSSIKSGIAPLLAVSSCQEVIIWQKKQTEQDGWISNGLSFHQGKVCDVQFDPSSLLLASVDSEGMLLLWQKAKQLVQRLVGVKSGFSTLAWHPLGNQLAAGGENGEVVVWYKSQRSKGFG